MKMYVTKIEKQMLGWLRRAAPGTLDRALKMVRELRAKKNPRQKRGFKAV